MKATYYKDTMHSYMVIPCPSEAGTTGYQYRMLEMNRIEGLLPCGIRHIDGEDFLYYEITGKQSLFGLYEGRKIPGAELRRLLTALERVEGTLAGYLLDEQHLVLTRDHIFYDFSSGTYSFAYYPGEVVSPEVFRFLAEGIDGSDKAAAAAAYRLCAAAERDRQALREAVKRELQEKSVPKEWETDPEEEPAVSAAAKREIKPGPDQEVGEPERYAGANEEEPAKRADRQREKGKKDGNTHRSGKRKLFLRILLILVLLAGAGGLFAAQLLLYISRRERRLCIAGSILLLISAVLIVAEMILRSRENRRKRREEKADRDPSYQESDEKDLPVFRTGRSENYRLHETEAGSTVRFSEQETVGRLYGRDRGNRIDLETLPVTVGKAQAYSDAVLSDPSVSRVHARIYKGEEGSIEIRDLDSTNGTFINGTRLAPNEKKRVQRGDEVRFGSVEYEYR